MAIPHRPINEVESSVVVEHTMVDGCSMDTPFEDRRELPDAGNVYNPHDLRGCFCFFSFLNQKHGVPELVPEGAVTAYRHILLRQAVRS